MRAKKKIYFITRLLLFYSTGFHWLISFSFFYPCLSLSLIHSHLISETLKLIFLNSLSQLRSSLSIHSLNSSPSDPRRRSLTSLKLNSVSQLPLKPNVTKAQLWSFRPTPPKPNVTEAQLRSLDV